MFQMYTFNFFLIALAISLLVVRVSAALGADPWYRGYPIGA